MPVLKHNTYLQSSFRYTCKHRQPRPECPGGGLVAELFKSISENITFVFICKGAHMMACGTNFFNQPQGQIKNEKGLYVSIFNSHM